MELEIPGQKVCEWCERIYARSDLRSTVGDAHWLERRFCQQSCRIAAIKAGRVFKRGPEHPCWLGDDVSEKTMRERSRVARHRSSDGWCDRCGFMLARETHHRDRNPANNADENLEFLCVTCHHLEHIGETVWDPPLTVAA